MAATRRDLRRLVLINLNDLVDETFARGERYTSITSNSTIVLDSLINAAMLHYAQKLDSFYQGYLNSDLFINLIANKSVYPLGPTFRSPIYHVKRILENNEYELKPYFDYFAVRSSIPTTNTSFFPTYGLEGNSIVFSYPPADNELAGVVVKFPKKIVELTSDEQEIDDQLYDAIDCIVLRATLRALKTKDVSGALKNAQGWNDELQEAERAFYMQVGNRVVVPDHPQPIVYDDLNYF